MKTLKRNKTLKRDRSYNRLIEIILNRKNTEIHIESLHNMVDTFFTAFKSKRKARKLRKLIHGNRQVFKKRTMLFAFVETIKF